ncbi:hypothetical protein L596_024986 [Steinernema carpocapsae]|uniref:sphinganine-1-phosphate aldolase n=1 Tax=Steinernema carpocapsae TaxID=34508 RepID=A0A4U5M6G4_STECR|nr:hypothetical protein L596_024986 [Steinernema carpocapsae]
MTETLKQTWTLVENGYEAVNDKLAKVDPVILVIGVVAGTVTYLKVRKLVRSSDRPILKRLSGWAFTYIRKLSIVRKKIEVELAKTQKVVEHSIHQYDSKRIFIRELPDGAKSMEEILNIAEKYEAMNSFDVDNGRVSGAVYTDRLDDHLELLTKIFHKYAYSNPLHPDVFPGCRKMEAEVIRMIANLYHGPETSCGTMTNGGTESIMLACLAYRNLAYSRGIADPVMVVPVTAHAAFDKAAGYFQMRIVHIPVDENQQVNLKSMKRAISKETCMLVGSSPNFPSGTIDNIVEISKMGFHYGIPVHVDACLGGFLVPFMEDAGFDMPLFDFRLPGVTSVSCDTHKYGNTPKGSSVVLYRSPEYLHHQYFCISEWPGGIYATPTLSGSRSGCNVALAWATLLYFGRNTYVDRARKIVTMAKKLAGEVAKIPGLKAMGKTDVSVVAFSSDEFNIYAVSDKLNKLGWNLNTLQNPASIHFCLTYNQASEEVIREFVEDLRRSCDEVRSEPNKGGDSKSAAIYGLAAQIPDKTLVNEVAFTFLDACYAMPEPESH